MLTLHFYLQRFPLILVLIGQYIIILAAVVGFVSLADVIAGIETNAMWQMILSVTIPFIVSAFVYYIAFFRQVKKANSILAELVSHK